MNRMGQGAAGLMSVGQGTSGLATDARNRALDATGQLGTLGNYYSQLPLQSAQQSWNMGTQLNTQEQSGLDKTYQDFLRTSSENNPYLNMIYQMATGQGSPQQYGQGTGTQLMGLLGGAGKMCGL